MGEPASARRFRSAQRGGALACTLDRCRECHHTPASVRGAPVRTGVVLKAGRKGSLQHSAEDYAWLGSVLNIVPTAKVDGLTTTSSQVSAETAPAVLATPVTGRPTNRHSAWASSSCDKDLLSFD